MSNGISHRQMLRSTSIIGVAAAINVVFSLLRIKAAALLLGPAGIGLIGLMQNLVASAAALSALGFGNVGTRQIAEAVGANDAHAVAAARRALLSGALALSVLGAIVFWLLRNFLAAYVLRDETLGTELGWLALGVLMTVIASAQLALLSGLRQVGDIAKVSVLSALFSTVAGIAILYLQGKEGLVTFILVVPFANLFFSHIYVLKRKGHKPNPITLANLISQWRVLARLGTAFMVASITTTIGQLVVRSLIQQDLGSNDLGQFQAAWAISMTYIGFILTAMGTDFYPRLTAVINERNAATQIINEQTEVALLLASPIFLIMLGWAPNIIELLYSAKFSGAVSILRWQILGDIFKLASFPLAYVMLATGAGRLYILTEASATILFIAVTAVTLTKMGVEAAGMAFFVMYVVYLSLVFCVARRRLGFRWTKRVRNHFGVLVSVAAAVHSLAIWQELAGAILGLATSILFVGYAFRRLMELSDSTASVVKKIRRAMRA